MALTLNLVQLQRKKRNDGTIPVYLRLTQNRKSKYKSTGISVLPRHWNAREQKIRRTHRHSKRLNRKLKKIYREYEESRDELEIKDKLTIENLKQAVEKGANPNSLITRAERYHRRLSEKQRFHEYKRFGVVVNNLKDFLGSRDTSIGDVDAAFIEDFQEYLLTRVNTDKDGNPKGNHPNTVRRKLRSLKGLFNRMLKKEEIKLDPFAAVTIVSKKSTSKIKLSPAQIKKIENKELEKGSDLWHVRNYFMYSFYNAGIRFGDLCTLTWSDIVDRRLKYTMRKTKGQKNIKQLKPMWDILDLYRTGNEDPEDYIFPILENKYSNTFELKKAIASKNARVNSLLKDLADVVEIEARISFHVSRHSFANYALKKDMDLYSISKALAHSDLSKTEQYLKSFDEEKLDADMEDIFN